MIWQQIPADNHLWFADRLKKNSLKNLKRLPSLDFVQMYIFYPCYYFGGAEPIYFVNNFILFISIHLEADQIVSICFYLNKCLTCVYVSLMNQKDLPQKMSMFVIRRYWKPINIIYRWYAQSNISGFYPFDFKFNELLSLNNSLHSIKNFSIEYIVN